MQTYSDTEEYAEQEITYEEPVSQLRGGKLALLFLWFLLLACLMYPTNLLHLGFMSLIVGMLGASIAIAIILLLTRWIKHKVATAQLTGKEWGYVLMGQTPPVVDAAGYLPQEPAQPSNETRRLPDTTTLSGREMILTSNMPFAEEDDELPEQILETDGMYFSNTYQPALHPVIGENVLLVGERGFGKSNFLAVAAEETGPYKVPTLFIDPEDQFSPLAERRFFPHGFIAGDPDLQAVQRTPLRNFIPVTPQNARAVGRKIVSYNLQVVFNMKSYVTLEDAAIVLNEMVRGILSWEEEHLNEDRLPVIFFFDEANKLLPQEPKEGGLRDKAVQDETYKTFFGLVNRGRNYGISIWFATQRIQQLHKNLLQCGYKFLFHQGQKVDLEQYAVFGLDPLDILSLQIGECFIFTPVILGFRCFIRGRVSKHQGHTPGLAQLRRYQQTHQLAGIRTMTGEQIAGKYYEEGTRSGFHLPEQHGFSSRGNQHITPQFSHHETDGLGDQDTVSETRPGKEEEPQPEPLQVNGITLTPEQYLAYQLHASGKTTIALLSAAMSQDGRFGKVDTNRAYALRNELVTLGLLKVRQKVPT